MSQEWVKSTVADSLSSVPVSGKSKIQKKDYLKSGQYPIIDQGKDFIAGWTNDKNSLIESPLPLIVFGDHTRAFKFLTYPFARGADGTQLLRPKAGIDPLFFFYACRAIDLPGRGYNRHFTTLKEKEFSYPESINEQRGIASVLYKLEESLNSQIEILNVLQELKNSAMHELFTRGPNREPQKETEIGLVPESWAVWPVSQLGSVKGGKRMPKGVSLVQENTGRPYIRVTDFADYGVQEEGLLFVPRGYEDVIRRYRISSNDVYISIAGSIGIVGQVPESLDDANLTENAAKIVIERNDVIPKYLMYALASYACQDQIQRATAKNAQPKLALTRIEQILVPFPNTIEEQRSIVTTLEALERKINIHKQKRTILDELFKTILHKLMSCEIQLSEINLEGFLQTEVGL